MKIVLITTSSFAVYDKAPLKKLDNFGYKWILNPYGRKMTEEEVFGLVDKYNPVGIVAGVEPLTKKVLKAGSSLRVISRCGVGLDSVDLVAAEEMSIVVTNTPDAPTRSVAEMTLGLIFALLRKIVLSDASIRNGGWVRPVGQLLSGKTVGLIGCGRIGSCLGEMLAVLGCKVVGYDPFAAPRQPVFAVSLQELLRQSDIVSLHLPYNPQTRNLIDANKLNIMKKGSFLINASRGGLVDEDALYESLKKDHLAGAALDCFAEEPYSGKLKDLDNVVLTGHIGSYSIEGRICMESEAVENLLIELDK